MKSESESEPKRKPVERVLCFPSEIIHTLGSFQGLSFDVKKYLTPLTIPTNVSYMPRDQAETAWQFKQIIPYVLVIIDGSILQYRRGKSGGETRLHDRFSIGFGGHVSSVDGTVGKGMMRELREELGIDVAKRDLVPVAVLNDDRTEVSRVHFGIVHVLFLPKSAKMKFAKEIQDHRLVPISVARKQQNIYESWSQFCLQGIDRVIETALVNRKDKSNA